jgi:hypothetical protein
LRLDMVQRADAGKTNTALLGQFCEVQGE